VRKVARDGYMLESAAKYGTTLRDHDVAVIAKMKGGRRRRD
jgi:hypothetical protein